MIGFHFLDRVLHRESFRMNFQHGLNNARRRALADVVDRYLPFRALFLTRHRDYYESSARTTFSDGNWSYSAQCSGDIRSWSLILAVSGAAETSDRSSSSGSFVYNFKDAVVQVGAAPNMSQILSLYSLSCLSRSRARGSPSTLNVGCKSVFSIHLTLHDGPLNAAARLIARMSGVRPPSSCFVRACRSLVHSIALRFSSNFIF